MNTNPHNHRNTLTWLSALILLLTLIAAGAGLFWPGSGQSYVFHSIYGKDVTIYGKGLYRFDSLSIAMQAIPQDIVTLIVGVPMLVIALLMYRTGSLRGRLLFAGTLGYFLYTYASYAFGASYNPMFLVYIALFTLSLYAFVLAMLGLDIQYLTAHVSERLPRRGIAILFFVMAAFLCFMHLGRLVPPLFNGTVPEVIETYTTDAVAVLDLGLIMPAAILAGILLWRKQPWGYLLAALLLIKGFTLATAVSAMAIGQKLAGVAVTLPELIMFPLLTAFIIYMTFRLMGNIVEPGTERVLVEVSHA